LTKVLIYIKLAGIGTGGAMPIIITINEELCTGCGVCSSLCPEVFELGEDGIAHVINPEGCNGCDCQEAADSCPDQAIIIEEEEEE